jgi:hypothetical protein
VEGVELAARFGSGTNHLKYCGPTDFHKAFNAYLKDKNKANAEKLKHTITHFEGHYPYLKLIAKENGMDPFDYEVCEAYWLGNELLEGISSEAVKEMILHDLTGMGKMQTGRAAELVKKLPSKVYPHHSFHVYFIKFITGKVDWNLFNADRCRVPFGKIIELKKNKDGGEGAVIGYKPILFGRGKYFFGEKITRNISFYEGNLQLIDPVEKGDWIAVHWDVGIMKLTTKQKNNLEKYTELNIESANSALGK